jgi:hypothetical protein
MQTKAYKSKTKINFSNFFLYFKRRSIHVPPKKKATLYLYSKCAFCSKTETHLTLCSGEPSLGAKLGLPDEFSHKCSPLYHLEMGM